MIISASRRTDIPAFYADWFFNRLREGRALVRNPRNPRRVSEVALAPATVDGFVFWTKNAAPMLGRLGELAGYAYYFLFTVTPYGPDTEPGVPDKLGVVVPAFKALSAAIGPGRVIWRYDPILVNGRYTVACHLEAFGRLARELEGHTRKCVISFLDLTGRARSMGREEPGREAREALAQGLLATATARGMALETCAEPADYPGLGRAHCVDAALLGEILGRPLAVAKDKGQRPLCGCVASVDIGENGTCRHGCRYCYAAHGRGAPAPHDPGSPLLAGHLAPGDTVTRRPMKPCQRLAWEGTSQPCPGGRGAPGRL